MPKNPNWRKAETHLAIALLLQRVQMPGQTSGLLDIGRNEFGLDRIICDVPSNIYPDIAGITDGEVVLCLCSGTDNLTQVASYGIDSFGPTLRADGGRWNATFYKAAQKAYTFYGMERPSKPKLAVWAGHSYGGATAQIAGYLSLANGWADDNLVVTFGAPRPGLDDAATLAGLVPTIRYRNGADPIPQFPPNIDLGVSQGVKNVSNAFFTEPGDWAQPCIGVQMPALSEPFMGFESSDQSLLQGNAGVVAARISSAIDAFHPLEKYTDRIRAALRGKKPAIDEAVALAALISVGFGKAPFALRQLREIQDMVIIPRGWQPTAKIVNGRALVFWAGRIIVETSNISRARTIAKHMRVWLKRMQNAAGAYPAALSLSLTEYMAAAGDPAGGFKPVLQARPG